MGDRVGGGGTDFGLGMIYGGPGRRLGPDSLGLGSGADRVLMSSGRRHICLVAANADVVWAWPVVGGSRGDTGEGRRGEKLTRQDLSLECGEYAKGSFRSTVN